MTGTFGSLVTAMVTPFRADHGLDLDRAQELASWLVANGSDAPIEELDPLAGIRAGVGRTIDERSAWHPEQAVTVQQAFEATCVTPA